MAQGFIFTQEDYDALCRRITGAGEQVVEHTAAVGGAAGSSGDAWHDNALYDAQRMSEAWSRSLRELLKVKTQANIVGQPPPRDGKVRFGTTVTIRDTGTGKKARYRISSYMIHQPIAEDGVRRISYASPLGRLLLGAAVDETKTGKIGDATRSFEVCDITV